MIRAKLTKISSTHENLRTNEMVGGIPKIPEVGETCVIVGRALTPGVSARMIHTTKISKVERISSKQYEFWTKNSHYGLRLLEEVH